MSGSERRMSHHSVEGWISKQNIVYINIVKGAFKKRQLLL